MTKIQFELDGKQVEAVNGETIWQVAKRQGREIPHLCYSPEPDYRPDGNCRACMVEVEGERLLQAHAKRRHEGEIGEPARNRCTKNGDGASGRRSAGARDLA
jgi:predicted molibdopterin-dependent oxidoreductase YjgC